MMSVISEKETHGGRVSLDMSLFSLEGVGHCCQGARATYPMQRCPMCVEGVRRRTGTTKWPAGKAVMAEPLRASSPLAPAVTLTLCVSE